MRITGRGLEFDVPVDGPAGGTPVLLLASVTGQRPPHEIRPA